MLNEALAQGLDDLLVHAGEDSTFYPALGTSFTLRVLYGNSSTMQAIGNFQAREYEHQFLCRASEITDKTRESEITINGRTFSIADVQIQGPAAMLYGE